MYGSICLFRLQFYKGFASIIASPKSYAVIASCSLEPAELQGSRLEITVKHFLIISSGEDHNDKSERCFVRCVGENVRHLLLSFAVICVSFRIHRNSFVCLADIIFPGISFYPHFTKRSRQARSQASNTNKVSNVQ